MQLPIYADNIEVVALVSKSYDRDIYTNDAIMRIDSHRGFEVYVNDVLVAYGPTITYYPEGNR